jgi:hypothetical protein
MMLIALKIVLFYLFTCKLEGFGMNRLEMPVEIEFDERFRLGRNYFLYLGGTSGLITLFWRIFLLLDLLLDLFVKPLLVLTMNGADHAVRIFFDNPQFFLQLVHLLLRVAQFLLQIIDFEVTVDQIHVCLFILFLVFFHIFMGLVVALVNVMLINGVHRLVE